ncbi:MAG: zinc-dependent metalloprotease, partial [Longimicrobiales bacterium]
GLVRSVTPFAEAVTVRQHHSFVELPTGYTPREADPRAGFFGISYMDFAVPIGESMTKRYIARHRLEKQDPAAAVSDAVEPIVYYLDPGTPEPVRSALIEGGRWWDQAFAAAGYRNAFRVEVLPDTADPMDIRYNVIQWVHRSTRGWSYGSSVSDPRTGEILKGHVTLGSLRVRQDYLLAEGLLSPYETGREVPPELEAMALARLRQLSAHEIGHTLGIAHNYIASTQGAAGRASVMDYPHPLVRLTSDGRIDLSNAYDQKIGEWDKLAVAYGYQDFPAGVDEQAALDSILADGARRGFTFLSDQDARPVGSAHPQTHLWDNGADAVQELERMLRVRAAALERFGETAIRSGRPLATLEEALVPLYLHHRYQTEAAVKSVGGVFYTYALRGETVIEYQRVPAAGQRAAARRGSPHGPARDTEAAAHRARHPTAAAVRRERLAGAVRPLHGTRVRCGRARGECGGHVAVVAAESGTCRAPGAAEGARLLAAPPGGCAGNHDARDHGAARGRLVRARDRTRRRARVREPSDDARGGRADGAGARASQLRADAAV